MRWGRDDCWLYLRVGGPFSLVSLEVAVRKSSSQTYRFWRRHGASFQWTHGDGINCQGVRCNAVTPRLLVHVHAWRWLEEIG